MKGDFTRGTFDPANHFSRVLMQQGRVQLDADWNEQTAIMLHLLRTMAYDVFGPHGGPKSPDLGFEIVTNDMSDRDDRLEEIEPDEARRKKLLGALSEGDAVIGPG